MALGDNPFVGLPAEDLAELRGLYVQILKDIATVGQSYAMQGRSFTAANLAEVRKTLGYITDAESVDSGTGKTVAQARMAGCGVRR